MICTQACDNVTLSDHLLRAVLNLLRREVSEHGRHLQQYFNLFVMYANLGKRSFALGCRKSLKVYVNVACQTSVSVTGGRPSAAGLAEKTQLLKLSVPATFMLVALDEGPGPPIKYQYAELGKLYTVVSQLVRCCDVSSRMQSSINGERSLRRASSNEGSRAHSCFSSPQVTPLWPTRTATPASRHPSCPCSSWWPKSCLCAPAT